MNFASGYTPLPVTPIKHQLVQLINRQEQSLLIPFSISCSSTTLPGCDKSHVGGKSHPLSSCGSDLKEDGQK